MNAYRLVVLGAMGIAALSLATSGAMGADLPDLVVPDGLGVNIHFTGAPARHLDMLRDGGFRFVRMDFVWDRCKRLHHPDHLHASRGGGDRVRAVQRHALHRAQGS